MDALKKLEPYVDQTLGVILSRLSQFGGKDAIIDMALWAQLFAFGTYLPNNKNPRYVIE
jgi:hypothetical protein